MRNSEIQMESGALYGGGGADVKNCYPRFLQLGATGLASRLMGGRSNAFTENLSS